MTKIVVTLLLVSVLVFGCSIDESITNVSNSPAFVIDALKISATVNTDSSSASRGTNFPMNLAFHFVGVPGSLDGISFSTDSLGIELIFEPYAPTPVGLTVSFTPEFRNPSTFPGQDSVLVRVGFGGRFWEKANATVIDHGGFSTRDSMWIQIQR
jgi:hypothetical protein